MEFLTKIHTQVDMSILLNRSELVENKGPGVGYIFNLNLMEIMVRWTNAMIDRAILRLRPIIAKLQKEKQDQQFNYSPGSHLYQG